MKLRQPLYGLGGGYGGGANDSSGDSGNTGMGDSEGGDEGGGGNDSYQDGWNAVETNDRAGITTETTTDESGNVSSQTTWGDETYTTDTHFGGVEHTATTVNPGTGQVQTEITDSFFGIATTNTYDVDMGQIENHTTEHSIGDFSLGYDTHYDDENRPAGFFTEMVVDVIETVSPNTKVSHETIGVMTAIEDAVGLATSLSPAVNLKLVATGKALPAVIGAWGMYTQAKTVMSLADRFGGSTTSESSLVDGAWDNMFGEGGGSLSEAPHTLVNGSVTQSKATPLTEPLLSPTTRYASLTSIIGEPARQDFSYQAMKTFRIDYGTEILKSSPFTLGVIKNEFKVTV